jgi:hypothetical protein
VQVVTTIVPPPPPVVATPPVASLFAVTGYPATTAGVAKSFLYPEINLTAGYSGNQASRNSQPPGAQPGTDRTFNNTSIGASVIWEADLFGRLRRNNEAAFNRYLASEEGRRAVLVTVVSDVATSYFLLRQLDLQLDIAKQTLAINDQTVSYYSTRLGGGVANKLEVDQAQANRSITASTIPELERQIALVEHAISVLVGRAAKSPFFKVKFESGKDGYIQPEAFHEELNVTIVGQDPQADAKQKAQKAVEDENQRIAWIQAQPWSAAAKDAAIKRRVAIGMNAAEVRKILGEPTRIIKARQMKGAGAEERWYYPERSTLVFTNGLLTHAEEKPQSQK